MKRLTKEAHQKNDDLSFANTAYFILENKCSQQYVMPNIPYYLRGINTKVGELSRWKHVVVIEIKDMTSKKVRLEIFWTLKIIDFYQQL